MSNKHLTKYTLLFLIFFELLSLFAWHLPLFGNIAFFLIIIATFALSLKNIAYGLFIAFSELIIDSHGYLFSLSLNNSGFLLSIRIGLFAVIMIAWIIKVLRDGGFGQYWLKLKSFSFLKYYLYLAIVVVWAFIWGLIRNDFANVFFDSNNWLFFLYLLPLLEVYQDKNFWRSFSSVLLASLSWLILKTFLLLYFFSHGFGFYLPEIYTWLRDTKVGEITFMDLNFYRIFLQSHIYALLAFLVLLPKTLQNKRLFSYFSPPATPEQTHACDGGRVIFLFSCLSIILTSFSRSFWVGLIAGLFIYIFFQFTSDKLRITNYKNLFKKTLELILIAILAVIPIAIIIFLPPKTDMANLANLFANRTTQMEAAGSSRLNMLKPLSEVIIRHPDIGSGFGATVTYKSVDPRILTTTAGASGEYNTYAFEWAYLDMFLKFSFFGLFIYLLLIFQIAKKLLLNIKNNQLYLGLFLALVSLLTVNIFTPYLNHPLGIGLILLTSVFTESANNKIIDI